MGEFCVYPLDEEKEKVEFCENCEQETRHLISPTGKKSACMVCGFVSY